MLKVNAVEYGLVHQKPYERKEIKMQQAKSVGFAEILSAEQKKLVETPGIQPKETVHGKNISQK